MSTANDRTANFKPTADSVEAVFLEVFPLSYLLIDGISGYVLGNITVKSGVKVRDRSGVLQIRDTRFDDRESCAVMPTTNKNKVKVIRVWPVTGVRTGVPNQRDAQYGGTSLD